MFFQPACNRREDVLVQALTRSFFSVLAAHAHVDVYVGRLVKRGDHVQLEDAPGDCKLLAEKRLERIQSTGLAERSLGDGTRGEKESYERHDL